MVFRETQVGLGFGETFEMVPSMDTEPSRSWRISTGPIMLATTDELTRLRTIIGASDASIAGDLLGTGDNVSAWNFTDVSPEIPAADVPRLVDGEAARQLARIATDVGWNVERVKHLADVTLNAGLVQAAGTGTMVPYDLNTTKEIEDRSKQLDVATGMMDAVRFDPFEFDD